MVPNVTTFVLLACACVTINAMPAPLKQSYMKIQEGSTEGFRRDMQPIILPQGQAHWEMPLPECLGEMVGVEVIVCDDGDGSPSVWITESNAVVVHKSGNLDSYTTVYITLYCLYPSGLTEQWENTTAIVKKLYFV